MLTTLTRPQFLDRPLDACDLQMVFDMPRPEYAEDAA